jgi:flavin-dependent dehydrogenase
MIPNDFDVIIIGAGPAGSSAAILLAKSGWSVALVEKQPFPRRKVCGECIAASNLPILEALGIGVAFEASAGPELKKVALMYGVSKIVADLPSAKHERYRWGKALGRETLDNLLIEQARTAGATILQPWSLQKIEGSAGDWRCEIRDEHSELTRILLSPIAIAANGSWESLPFDRPIRRLARSSSDLFAFKANFKEVNLDNGLLALLSFTGGYGGMVVADNGITTIACCIRRDRLESLRVSLPSLSVGIIIETMLKHECKAVENALQGAKREGKWLTVGPINPGMQLRADDGLFRIGNAAGEAHPIIGEGMSMALQSSWLLCAQLLKSKNQSLGIGAICQKEVARAYASEWRKQFQTRLWLSATFAHIVMRPASSTVLVSIMRRWPSLLTLGAKLAGKVHSAVNPANTFQSEN